MESLIGKWLWVCIGEPEEGYLIVGEIVEIVGSENYLVRPVPRHREPSHQVLISLTDCATYCAKVFNSREELDDWLAWLDKPDDDGKPRIVRLPVHPTRN